MKYKDVKTVKTGYTCNNHCKFCCFAQSRDLRESKSYLDICEEIYKNSEIFDKLLFLGGEVTIRSDFIKLISFAKRKGYKEIQIQTNARILSYFDIAKKSVEAGATHFIVSFHTNTPETHDWLTESKGSFLQTVNGIKNLKKLKVYVKTNTVISKYNYGYLPEIIDMILFLNVDEVRFSLISIMGGVLDNEDMFTIRMKEIMPNLVQILQKVVGKGIPYEVEGIPKCLLVMWLNRLKIEKESTNKILEGYKENILADEKIKGINCKNCNYYVDCQGPWINYVKNFGWEEFKPL